MANSERVAIITGAARPWGLGRCTALGLAAKGLDIAVVDFRDDWGAEAVSAIKEKHGRNAVYVRTDLRQRGDIHAMVERVLREFGRIDVLVNVAAIGLGERVEDMKEETYEQIFRTNFWGTALCCQAVLKQMRSQKSGHIVNIASGGAITPYEGFALLLRRQSRRHPIQQGTGAGGGEKRHRRERRLTRADAYRDGTRERSD
jgi:NAD(P)-dependent dehydrogenase (short-subunit alcohol dehydrogenase family)